MHGSWIYNTGDKWEGSAGKKNSKTLDFYNEALGNLIWLLGGKGNPAPRRKPTDGMGALSWELAGKGLWNTSKLHLPAAQLSRNTSTFIGQITQFVICPHKVLTPFLSGSALWSQTRLPGFAVPLQRCGRQPVGVGRRWASVLGQGGCKCAEGWAAPRPRGAIKCDIYSQKQEISQKKKHVGSWTAWALKVPSSWTSLVQSIMFCSGP